MSFPTLHTDRLILRAPLAADCEAYCAYAVSDRTRFVGGPRPRHAALEKFAGMIGHWHLRGFGRFVLEDRASGAALGHCGPFRFDVTDEPELSWTLWSAEAEGRGIAREAAHAVMGHLRATFDWPRTVTSIHRENIASQHIARAIGGRNTGEAAPFLKDAEVWEFPMAATAEVAA